jgi:hypothetical protein
MALTEAQKKAEGERRAKVLQEYMHSEAYMDTLMLRLKLLDAAGGNVEAQKQLWNICYNENDTAAGIIFFINNFLFTYSPKTEPKHLPFILFPFQEDEVRWLVDHIDGKTDGLIEKSREMGVTWLVAAVALYYWIFRDGTNVLFGSYKERLVDDYTDDSIFGKLDYLLEGLPKWMLPHRFNKNKHRTKLKLVNPVNNNLISGDTMNPNFGRGSRKTWIFFDELGFWDYAKDAWGSAGDTTECRIANSTPNGYDFYAQLRESGIDVLTLHWKLHPLKDDLWYEYEKARRTDEELAQEVDISYSKSKEGRVYPEWNDTKVAIGRFEYDPSLPLYVGWDFGKTDDTAIIWAQKDTRTNRLRIVDSYRNNGKNIDFYVPLVTGFVPSDKYRYTAEELEIIERHKHWKPATHYGDPAGRFQNNVTDNTVIDELRMYNIHINFRDDWKYFKARKSATKRLIMGGIDLNETTENNYLNICMINSSYPKVKVNGIDEVRSEKPKHDAYSHHRSAFEYLALGLETMMTQRRGPVDKFEKRNPATIKRKRGLIGY